MDGSWTTRKRLVGAGLAALVLLYGLTLIYRGAFELEPGTALKAAMCTEIMMFGPILVVTGFDLRQR